MKLNRDKRVYFVLFICTQPPYVEVGRRDLAVPRRRQVKDCSLLFSSLLGP